MQFKCSSCQAKYQIADEKVAGKTVRMKCRKCGAPIEVRAKVTDGGLVGVPVESRAGAASSAQPTTPSPAAGGGARPPIGSGAGTLPAGAAGPGAPPGPHRPVHPPGGPAAAPPSRAPLAPPRAPPPRAVPPPRPPAGAPPRPPGVRAAPGAEAPPPPPSRPLGLTPGVRPFGPASPLKQTSPGAFFDPDADAEDEATVVVARPALDQLRAAGAIRPAAGAPAAPAPGSAPGAPTPEPAPSPPSSGTAAAQAEEGADEQWFVGIGGRPVGPKPRAFLRERLAAGEITRESLVWREDFTEWRPLGSIDALSGILSVAAASPEGSSSAGQAAPDAGSAPGTQRSVAAAIESAPGSANELSQPTGPSVPPPAPSAPVALVRVKEEDAVAFDQGPAVLAASAASARSEGAPAEATDGPASAGASSPGGVPVNEPDSAGDRSSRPTTESASDEAPRGGGGHQPGTGLVSDLDEEEHGRSRHERRRRSRGVKPVVWAFVAMAGAFGGVAAYVVFSAPPGNPPPGGVAAASPTMASGGAAAEASPGDPTATADPSTIVLAPVSVEPGANGSGVPVASGTGAPASSGSSGRATDIDLSGFNTAGPSGPSAGPGSTAGSESRGELTSADISAVVSRYKGGVSRRCLPLVEAGGSGGATSARVVAHLVIGPSGNVQSASASGGKEFPGLADCVAGRVRSWKFPASGGTTPVDVPFHFIAQ